MLGKGQILYRNDMNMNGTYDCKEGAQEIVTLGSGCQAFGEEGARIPAILSRKPASTA